MESEDDLNKWLDENFEELVEEAEGRELFLELGDDIPVADRMG